MITLPTAEATLASTSAYSSVFFNEFIEYQWIAIGIALVFMIIGWIIWVFRDSISGLFATKPRYNEGEMEARYKAYWSGPNKQAHYQKHYDDQYKF